MGYENIFLPEVKWNKMNIGLFISLLVLPNILGLINLSTGYGFNIHFFQVAIFIAAFIYGPKGGMLSGLFGSAYSAIAMNNPYIIVGNMILGFCAGIFSRKFSAIPAIALAYAIQLPWLLATDYYLVHLPVQVLLPLVVSLAISNVIWAFAASKIAVPVKGMLA